MLSGFVALASVGAEIGTKVNKDSYDESILEKKSATTRMRNATPKRDEIQAVNNRLDLQLVGAVGVGASVGAPGSGSGVPS